MDRGELALAEFCKHVPLARIEKGEDVDCDTGKGSNRKVHSCNAPVEWREHGAIANGQFGLGQFGFGRSLARL